MALYKAAIDAPDGTSRREAVRMRADETLQMSVNQALEERGIVLHPSDPAWRKLELAFIAQRSAISAIQSRLSGDIVLTPEIPTQSTETLTSALNRWAAMAWVAESHKWALEATYA